MDTTRITIIIGMGLVSYLIRVAPQLFLVGRRFSEAFERYLRYLSYAIIASIISSNLFLTGPQFEAAAAPHRAFALFAAVLVASWSKKPLLGMFTGTFFAVVLPWLS